MSTLAKLPVRMTIQDFFCWEPGDGQRYELVNGEPRAMALARPVHGFLHAELGALIGNHLQANAPCFKAVMNPAIIPRFLSSHNLRIPELGMTSAAILPASSHTSANATPIPAGRSSC